MWVWVSFKIPLFEVQRRNTVRIGHQLLIVRISPIEIANCSLRATAPNVSHSEFFCNTSWFLGNLAIALKKGRPVYFLSLIFPSPRLLVLADKDLIKEQKKGGLTGAIGCVCCLL